MVGAITPSCSDALPRLRLTALMEPADPSMALWGESGEESLGCTKIWGNLSGRWRIVRVLGMAKQDFPVCCSCQKSVRLSSSSPDRIEGLHFNDSKVPSVLILVSCLLTTYPWLNGYRPSCSYGQCRYPVVSSPRGGPTPRFHPTDIAHQDLSVLIFASFAKGLAVLRQPSILHTVSTFVWFRDGHMFT